MKLYNVFLSHSAHEVEDKVIQGVNVAVGHWGRIKTHLGIKR